MAWQDTWVVEVEVVKSKGVEWLRSGFGGGSKGEVVVLVVEVREESDVQ